jgi:hypothetical protein
MPRYQCRFLSESEQVVVRLTVLRSSNAYSARREVMSLITKTADFDGYELWEDGEMVDAYRPGKSRGTI